MNLYYCINNIFVKFILQKLYGYRMKKKNIFKNYLYYIGLFGFTLNIKKNDLLISLNNY
jgi:hypothetical protein